MPVLITGGVSSISLTTKGGYSRATVNFSGGPLSSVRWVSTVSGPEIWGSIETRNSQNSRDRDAVEGYVNISIGISNPLAFTFGAQSGTGVVRAGIYSRIIELKGRDGSLAVQTITVTIIEDPAWPYSEYVPPDDGGFTTGAPSPAPSPAPSTSTQLPEVTIDQSLLAPVSTEGLTGSSGEISAATNAAAAAIAATAAAFTSFGNDFATATDANTAAIADQTERFRKAYEDLRKELTRLLETKNKITVAEGIVGLGTLYTYFQNLGWSSIEVISKYENTILKNEALIDAEPVHANLNPAQDHVEERFIETTDHLNDPEEY